MTGGLDELREDGRPFDAIDRLIARVGLERPLSMAEAAMERHDALLAVVDAAEKLIAGAIGDEDNWLNEWCAMFNAVDAFKKGNK